MCEEVERSVKNKSRTVYIVVNKRKLKNFASYFPIESVIHKFFRKNQ